MAVSMNEVLILVEMFGNWNQKEGEEEEEDFCY